MCMPSARFSPISHHSIQLLPISLCYTPLSFLSYSPYYITTNKDNTVKEKGKACSQKVEITITTDRLYATMSLQMLHGNNRKQHRYFAILSCDFKRSVLFNCHIPK